MMSRLTLLFPLWALLASLVAFYFPVFFTDMKNWIVPLLMLVMLGMGFALRWQDFQGVLRLKKAVSLGVLIQFTVMPLAAFVLARLFGLSDDLTIGMMLVGATAGGTASNVMTYLANGNVALSVSMTLVSTLTAVVALPFLTWLYLGQTVEVPVSAMMGNLVQLIVVPVVLGMLLGHVLSGKLSFLDKVFPIFSMMAIVLIVAIVVALNHSNLSGLAISLIVVIMLHNVIGLGSAYFISRRLGYDTVISRTLAIEVGMQNSGLSVALALQYFSALSALPGALFSVWHNLSGALFASYWQYRRDKV
ncbi:MAG: bile acid:sodium symporter family protein [Thiomicrorhabdus chilensis]|uniref:bile acid:sodium symporter family protein n=1 Tax=Thiomicrorhabdus chilensis TaxID=63656 RepID=UPI00299E0DDE|nr:bile acid:sodium symporter family protein [Thiomicrorhabdus chilensis]MDX1347089.1 bile acid:sodium symporter family protein [Thiomicrorhabdus chilensis]